MLHPFHVDEIRYPVRMRWILAIAWVVILAKCVVVTWAMNHWHVPIHPGWVVVPTLLLAAGATWLWIDPHLD
jgi:hypothetical protein